MKHILLVAAMILSSFANANEMSNPCVYHPDLPGCAGNNRPMGQTKRVINIPDRWGAIYFNGANRAIGVSENNTKSEESARREALANCIKNGGGKNPIASNGQGCHFMTEYVNGCGAIAIGGVIGNGRVSAKSDFNLEAAEQNAIDSCEKNRPFKCTIRYSGCSRHPDYLRY